MPLLVNINRGCQEKLKKCLVLHIGVFLCMYKPEVSAGAKCGRPGRTSNSVYEPSGKAFNESDVIRYICTEKDQVIFGASERRCLNSGSWSDEIPVCSKQAKFENVEQLFQDPEEKLNVTVDGDISTCSLASKHNQTIWRGYLPTSINISAVRITLLGMGQVDIDVIIQGDYSAGEKKCRIQREYSEVTMKSSRTLTFFCPAETVGKYVHITCNYQDLRICEVAVLLPSVSSCLSPDNPLHGNGFVRTSGRDTLYQFACETGYKRWGTLLTKCQADGRWLPATPVCEEIYCTAPDKLENGYIEYYLKKGRVPYNGTAKYFCNKGFYLEGYSTIRCHRWENWDFPAPVCKPISESTTDAKDVPIQESWRQSNVTHCGTLPHVANGGFIVNSSNVGSKAWLKCSTGFTPLTDDYVSCLPTGRWSSQSLLCKMIECEASPVIPHGKAILLNNSTYYGAHLEIICNQGYISRTPITRKCNEFGTWGDLSICVEITCGTFATTDATEGQWLSINGSTFMRVLICPEDFHIEGSPAIIRCLLNGSWSYTSAKCKGSVGTIWGNNWTPSLLLIAAIGVGAGTAILILCLSATFLVIRKRRQSQTNTTVFHLENTSHNDGMGHIHRQKHHSAVENFESVVERRSNSICTNPRKPRSALPNLPVDADPVYAQPFETATAAKKTSVNAVNKKEDLYNTHIYAEPVDSRRQTAINLPMCMSMSRMGTDTRISTIKTNFEHEPLTSVQIDQNCDKKCAIYDSSSNSTLNSWQFATDEKYQRYKEKAELGTLTKNLEYLELL